MSLWDDMAVVGRVARPHGLRGQVIVNVETDFPQDRFKPGAELFVNRRGQVESMAVQSVRFHQARPVIALRGIDDVNAAGELAGAELRVPRQLLTPLPDGTFYRHDLVGCAVETEDGRQVGTVTEVEGTLGGSRLVVACGSGDVLVPLASDICRSIDPAAKRIVIRPPEGLLELNRKS
jgi:16S rRNA processing protein RimM